MECKKVRIFNYFYSSHEHKLSINDQFEIPAFSADLFSKNRKHVF